MTRRNELGTEVVRTRDEPKRRARDPSSSDFGSGPHGYPRISSTDSRTSTFLYANSPTTPIPHLVDSFGQLRLGSIMPEPGPSSQDGGTRQFPPHLEGSDELAARTGGKRDLVTTLSDLTETMPAESLSDSDGPLGLLPVVAPASADQLVLPPRTQQHWVHPTRRASPYEYQHEHDEDRTKEEAARREQQKDAIMRKCIAERKERLRRSLVPILDLTGDCSEEEGVGMEIDHTL